MIPKPPFASELTLRQELEAFERLKPRLSAVWNAVSARAEEPYTSVVIPSMTLDESELTKLEGATFYEERLLFLLVRLRNPRAHMVYVTSQPVHPVILEYYFQLLQGIPASHARSRLTLLCAYDASPRSLTQKILERPRLIQRIRYGISDPSRAYMTVFNSTDLERRLSVLLDIPLNGVDPALQPLGSKSGSRKVFREAGVRLPAGREDVRSADDVAQALGALRRQRPGITRAVVKLDEGFSGSGNALFTYPQVESPDAIAQALPRIAFSDDTERLEPFLGKMERMGGVVEEFIDGVETRAPSAQLRIDPKGEVFLLSTHDQVMGGPTGQTYLGCRFPAHDDYRIAVQEAAMRVGSALAARGVVSRFGVDFLATRASPGEPWDLNAIEINLRMGGTTHPFLALQFLTGGRLDAPSGLFLSQRGIPKYYMNTDNLRSDAYRGLNAEDLIEITTANRLHYDHGSESGALFHMIGALSQFGKVGLTAIGNSHEEAAAIQERATGVLDQETGRG
ncbi:MAG TPA: peptide ligase PGM1-related protein [Thermoanaerobaculia bacterium]|nr:peptide ligase PGM1-related protein [Thermoanaerobaculia bacterium]